MQLLGFRHNMNFEAQVRICYLNLDVFELRESYLEVNIMFYSEIIENNRSIYLGDTTL